VLRQFVNGLNSGLISPKIMKVNKRVFLNIRGSAVGPATQIIVGARTLRSEDPYGSTVRVRNSVSKLFFGVDDLQYTRARVK